MPAGFCFRPKERPIFFEVSFGDNLNNICEKNGQICGQLFDRLPLDIRQKLLEYAILSLEIGLLKSRSWG